MNEPLILIPDFTSNIEELLTLQIDSNTPDEDVRAITQFNNIQYQWFNNQVDTEYYLDATEEFFQDGAQEFLNHFEQVLKTL